MAGKLWRNVRWRHRPWENGKWRIFCTRKTVWSVSLEHCAVHRQGFGILIEPFYSSLKKSRVVSNQKNSKNRHFSDISAHNDHVDEPNAMKPYLCTKEYLIAFCDFETCRRTHPFYRPCTGNGTIFLKHTIFRTYETLDWNQFSPNYFLNTKRDLDWRFKIIRTSLGFIPSSVWAYCMAKIRLDDVMFKSLRNDDVLSFDLSHITRLFICPFS